jgi:hypothetical protein
MIDAAFNDGELAPNCWPGSDYGMDKRRCQCCRSSSTLNSPSIN